MIKSDSVHTTRYALKVIITRRWYMASASNGLQALQTVSIVAALPFLPVMTAMAVAFVKSVIKDPALKLDKAA